MVGIFGTIKVGKYPINAYERVMGLSVRNVIVKKLSPSLGKLFSHSAQSQNFNADKMYSLESR